jgi:hypothetical protein
MGRRKKEVDVSSDVDLLERVLGRSDLDPYESGAFGNMLETLRQREEEYREEAYGLSDLQREWAERVAARVKTRMSGKEFVEVVCEIIGRSVRLLTRARKSKAAATQYAVRVGERVAVVGFRYPESKSKPGEGDNVVRDGEVRVASHCVAVLGTPSSLMYAWDSEAPAAFIAAAIPGARVAHVRDGE